MNDNRLNFIYKLNHIVNENSQGTVEYELAKFFLEHLKESASWNIYDIAEDNHVSRASIRRFSKQLGYENFLDMKKNVDSFDDGIGKLEDFYGYPDFLTTLQQNIQNLMQEFSIRFNTQEVNRLIKMINDHEEVAIICSSNIAGSVKTFQQRMIIFGKRITLLTSKEEVERLSVASNQPLLIIFSITGLFVSSMLEILREYAGQTVLFTNNRNPIYNQVFDKLYHLSAQHQPYEINQLLYYTYGVDFVFDLLLNGYVLEYKKERN